jgi:hypothetical protein
MCSLTQDKAEFDSYNTDTQRQASRTSSPNVRHSSSRSGTSAAHLSSVLTLRFCSLYIARSNGDLTQLARFDVELKATNVCLEFVAKEWGRFEQSHVFHDTLPQTVSCQFLVGPSN